MSDIISKPLCLRLSSSDQAETAVADPILRTYHPRTPIGEALLALRRACLESGGCLMGWDEIAAEVRQRRGEDRE